MRLSYFTEPVDQAAQLAIDHRLHRHGWELVDVLHHIRADRAMQKYSKIVVASFQGKPIGIACTYGPITIRDAQGKILARGPQAMFYVKPRFRRMGVGRKLARRLKAQLGSLDRVIGLKGGYSSPAFFQNVGIRWDYVHSASGRCPPARITQ